MKWVHSSVATMVLENIFITNLAEFLGKFVGNFIFTKVAGLETLPQNNKKLF